MAKAISDKNWEARSDFYSLSTAEEIKSDKKRYSSALKAGKGVVKEKKEEVKAMKKIATKKASPKRQTKKRK